MWKILDLYLIRQGIQDLFATEHNMAELTNLEKRMLPFKLEDGNWTLEEILEACDWDDQAIAVAAGHGLSNQGHARLSETSELA